MEEPLSYVQYASESKAYMRDLGNCEYDGRSVLL